MVETLQQKLSVIVDDAVRQLVRADHYHAGSLVRLPVIYPSGASVVLEIFRQKDRFFISDRGGAFDEVDLMGAHRYFTREATRIAEEAGIKFDGRSMFVAEAPIDALPGAMVVVAHCSQQAASHAVLKHAERAQIDMKDVLYARLRELYTPKRVVRDAEFIGASSHVWKVAVLVSEREDSFVFETVTNHYNSVVSAVAKFGDIARLEIPPRRIAVVQSRRVLGDFVGVLAPTSTSVIEIGASDETYKSLLAA